MTPLNGGALPNKHVVTEVAEDVAVVQLVHIRGHVVSLRQVEVDVLLRHSLVHL